MDHLDFLELKTSKMDIDREKGEDIIIIEYFGHDDDSEEIVLFFTLGQLRSLQP